MKYFKRCGSMQSGGNSIAVYRILNPLKCGKCMRQIEPSELATRGSKKDYKSGTFICSNCKTAKIDIYDYNKHPLNYFINENDWWMNANGNALELLDQIAKARGYSVLKRNRSFAFMVIENLRRYNKTLGDRFYELFKTVEHEFPKKPSEFFLAIAEMEKERQ